MDDIHDIGFTIPRGIRNLNPGNLKYSEKITWMGQIGHDDDGFIIFHSALMGLRALFITLLHYYLKEDLKTVADVIHRYAPPDRNPDKDYVRFVCDWTGLDPDAVLNSEYRMLGIGQSIIRFENGYSPYSPASIREAWHLALKAFNNTKGDHIP